MQTLLMRWALAVHVSVGAALIADQVAAQAPAPLKITVGNLSSISDAGIYIADKKGYFRDEGLAVTLTTFRSGADMVPSLGTGQIDVGAGSPSAGLYNAIARGLKIKIVADKAYSPAGYAATKLIIRKDLIDSGRVKVLADLKGLKIATNAPGVSNQAMLNTGLVAAGLKFADIATIDLPFPEHPIALRNKAVDGGATIEPFATMAVEQGVALTLKRDDEIDLDHQLACILYAEAFSRDKPDAALGFMRAYIKGVRFYNGALADGRLAGPNAEEVISILAEYTAVKDRALLAKITPTGLHPDGRVNVASLQRDLDFYASLGLIQGKLAVRDMVDTSYTDTAVKALGPWK